MFGRRGARSRSIDTRRRLAGVIVGTLAAATLSTVTGASPARAAELNLTQYVNPFLGSTAGGQSFPGEAQPFGMMQWSLDTNSGEGNQYDYSSKTAAGFSLTHYTGFGPRVVNFVPYVGSVDPTKSPGSNPKSYWSTFSHANESAEPGYYQVRTDNQVNTELTGTKRAGLGKFTYPTGGTSTMMINLGDSPQNGDDKPVYNSVSVDVANRKISGFAGHSTYKLHFVAQFDHAFTTHGTFLDDTVTAGGTSTPTDTNVGAYVTFDTSSLATVGVRVGISYVSVANAQANLDAEISSSATFDSVRTAAKATWNTVLNKFVVTDSAAQHDDLVKHYTHLYLFLLQPNTVSDVNGEYWGADNAKHTVPSGRTQYSNVAHWDHGRSYFALLALLYPNVTSDVMRSLLDAADQRVNGIPGFMFPFLKNGATGGFGGNHYSLPAQAYVFGARNFDVNKAITQLIRQSTVSSRNSHPGRGLVFLNSYLEKGYASQPDGGGAPYEATQQYALTDFATSRLTLAATGNGAQVEGLARRSGNWSNTWLSTATDNGFTGYAWDRKSDGTFRPWVSSTDGMGSSTQNVGLETCSAQHSYFVPQDIANLSEAMGGRAEFVRRLDHFFSQYSTVAGSFADDSGARPTCQYYTPKNEPDLQVPWQYNWAGAPSKAQARVRDLITTQYTNATNGIPQNNDWGALSAWYLQAEMGLYPEIQGVGGFSITAPLFAKVVLTSENGKTITVTGANASRANGYIQSATLNGSTYDSTWIPYENLVNSRADNTLAFTLGNTASTWGTTATVNPPPSFDSLSSTNIALKGTVTGNGTACNSTTESAAKAVDGDPATKWCQGLVGGTAALKVDLGAPKLLTGFSIRHASAGGESSNLVTRNYKIQVSSTGSDTGTWTDLVTQTSNTQALTAYTVTPTTARWVRLAITAPEQGTGTGARIYDFSVFGGGQNVAASKTATGNGTACNTTSETPARAVDGSTSTKWCQALVSGAANLKVDLGASREIAGFTVRSAGSESSSYITKDYKIQWSSDGSDTGTWTDLVTVRGNTQDAVTSRIPVPKVARWVRLSVTAPQQGAGGVARIKEFEVHQVGRHDVAIGATATANGTACSTSETPSRAVDGDPATKWCQDAVSGVSTLKLDLGSSTTVTGFRLLGAVALGTQNTEGTYIPKAFKIQYSADGSDSGTWTDISGTVVTDNTKNEWGFTLPSPQTHRHLRLYVTALTGPPTGTTTKIQVPEFSVYGG